MRRCLHLAQLGAGYVAPNPMVGAVLVHNGNIIGEGYHRQYGEAHAEVNCIGAVREENRHLISQSILYVSLEPCNHFGQTPPCTELIIRHKIPKVVIGCRDPFEPSATPNNFQPSAEKGIEKLTEAGISVTFGILELECRQLNLRFFTFQTQHRPYIILKWAQSLDEKIALMPSRNESNQNENVSKSKGVERLMITNEFTNRIVHKWRSEEMGILVGTNTALADDPELSTRLWPGQHPLRMVIDKQLVLPATLKLFNAKHPTIVFNVKQHTIPEKISVHTLRSTGLNFYQVTDDVSLVHQIVHALYRLQIQSVMVEGGSYLLQSFVDEGAWDEARVITNESLIFNGENSLPAPVLKDYYIGATQKIHSDVIRVYTHKQGAKKAT